MPLDWLQKIFACGFAAFGLAVEEDFLERMSLMRPLMGMEFGKCLSSQSSSTGVIELDCNYFGQGFGEMKREH